MMSLHPRRSRFCNVLNRVIEEGDAPWLSSQQFDDTLEDCGIRLDEAEFVGQEHLIEASTQLGAGRPVELVRVRKASYAVPGAEAG
jgi:hypothetical protein